MRILRIWVLILIVLLVHTILFISCSKNNNTRAILNNKVLLQENNKLTIATTTGFIYDLVEAVVGNKANVIQIIGSGVDPHTYVPSRSDVIWISQSDIVFYNGLHLEGNLYTIFNRIDNKKPVYAIADLLDSVEYIQKNGGATDPHIWMDARIWSAAVLKIGEQLAQIDPINQSYYYENAQEYTVLLQSLHVKLTQLFLTIPSQKRVLITSHDAFGYFGNAYGFQVLGIQGISTVLEASLKTINNIIDFVIEREVGAIFVESSVSHKYIQAVIEGARHRGHMLVEGGVLFADSLGIPGTRESSYIGMMEYNAITISRALLGTDIDYEPININNDKNI